MIEDNYRTAEAYLLIWLVIIVSYFRIRDCLTQLYAKDITPDDKQELDEALQREVCKCQLWNSFIA